MITKFISLIKQNLTGVVLTLFWLVITVFNLKGYWMLVDDGEGVVFARMLFEKMASLNLVGFISQLFETNGRFRPIYWLYQMIVWFIGRNSYQFHHFAHMLVIGAGMVSVYLIVKSLTKSKSIPLFASLFFLLTPLNTENIFRLGPQEPLMVVFFGIMFYLLIIAKKPYLTSLLLVFAIFTKETSIGILPLIFFYYIVGRKSKIIKNKKQGFYLFVAGCLSVVMMILITLARRGGYSTNYTFDFPMIVENLSIYFKELAKNTSFVFPLIPIVYMLRVVINLTQKKKIFESKQDLFEFIFFAGFILFLGMQLPWKYALTRYLMPACFFFTVFSFIEVSRDLLVLERLKIVKKYKRLIYIFLLIFVLYVFSLMALNIILKISGSISNREAFKRMAEYPPDTTIFINMRRADSTVELVYETQVHLSEFWNRPDIKVHYLDLQKLPVANFVVVASDQFPGAYPRETLDAYFKNNYAYLENKNKTLILTTPVELIKQSVKKLAMFIISKKQFTGEGIYTFYYNNSSWYFYHE